MSFFGWGKSGRDTNTDHTGRNLQDGLFQIASQACHILVQVNNTHNVSYGGSNRVTNVAYSKYSGGEGSTSLSSPATSPPSAPASGVYTKNVGTDPLLKDQDVVVLLPQRKSRTPRIRHKLARDSSVVVETYPGCRQIILQSFTRKCYVEEAAEVMIASITSTTLKRYEKPIKLWWNFCKEKNFSLCETDTKKIIKFFTEQNKIVKSYSTLNLYRAVISLIMNNKVILASLRTMTDYWCDFSKNG